MPGAPSFLLSDAHLGPAPEEVERSLLALLARARAEAKSVVLNGDVFDFWFEWRHVMPRTGFRVLAALAGLRQAGVEVLWIAGNHDCWGGDVLRREVGVTYHEGPWRGELAGWRTLIEHGDGLREKEDAPYRALRAVLRNRVAIRLFRALHPDLATRIALGSSHTSRNWRPKDGGEGLRRVALERLRAEPALDLYVFGHSHARTAGRAESGAVYANPGAWLDEPTFLRITPERVEVVRLAPGPVEVLETLERRARG
ncbi:MAG TPA: UDP-2,3-diacylglucosamine diphosphatase [Gemmatimonadaceae bacterium]|nr:UDP-2,3-diacylglucosamine diphosphatase [Gemmatimonadaceae bacterium]